MDDVNDVSSADLPAAAGQPGAARRAAWSADGPSRPFLRRAMAPASLGPDDVEVAVDFCGLCGSDLALWRDEWRRTRFPFVGGHEVVGRVVALGQQARGLAIGQRVGLGWYSGSCLTCAACRSGRLHQCVALQRLVIDRQGGFATHVRTHWAWTFPLPDAIPDAHAAPLLCAGITVHAPIAAHVRPIHRTAVIGVGGLGHLAIQFLAKSGCEVVAFTKPGADGDDVRRMGAHVVLPTHVDAATIQRAGPFDFILVTTSAPIDLAPYAAALGSGGRLHVLGVGCAPIGFSPDLLMPAGAQVSSSAIGSPGAMLDMLAFAARHRILPEIEVFPMSRIADAFERLASGAARYRIVLQSDFASMPA